MDIQITFEQLKRLLRKLRDDGEFEKAIELIDLQGSQFPDQRLFLAYWQICMAGSAVLPELAYHFMDELITDSLWISNALLRQSPHLASFQGFAEFEKRLTKFSELENLERRKLLPLIVLHKEQSEESSFPLLLGLHDDDETAISSIRSWQTAAELGWIVGVPQSSQALWSGAYLWDNYSLAEQEIRNHVENLIDKYSIDPRRMVIAGVGKGAELAMWLAVTGTLPFTGFISLFPRGPIIENPDQWMSWLQKRDLEKLRGVVLMNSDDGGILKAEILRTIELFKVFGVDCRLTTFTELEKMYPLAYKDVFEEALNFIITK